MGEIVHSLAVGSILCIGDVAFVPVTWLMIVAAMECVWVTLAVGQLVDFRVVLKHWRCPLLLDCRMSVLKVSPKKMSGFVITLLNVLLQMEANVTKRDYVHYQHFDEGDTFLKCFVIFVVADQLDTDVFETLVDQFFVYVVRLAGRYRKVTPTDLPTPTYKG